MESVILATPQHYGDVFRKRLARLSTVSRGGGGVVVLDGGTRVYIYEADLQTEMEPERLSVLTAGGATSFHLVDFADIEAVRRVLTLLVDDQDITVDNDHGVVLRGPDFVARLRDDPSWDWRND